MSKLYKEFLQSYIPEWYEIFDEYSDIDKEGNIFVYKKEYDYKLWCNEKGQFHRIDGPAFISDYCIVYWVNNKTHNINGPAYIAKAQYDHYCLNNIEYCKKEWKIERLKYV